MSYPSDATGLTFDILLEANRRRLPQFRNSRGEPAHREPDGSDWSPAQWLQAVVGELGEYANLMKKVDRGDLSVADALPDLADELADVQTYLAILADQIGVDLGAATGAATFADLRSAVRRLRVNSDSTDPFGGTAAELLQSLISKLGKYAGLMDLVRYEAISLQSVRPQLAVALGEVQLYLTAIADAIGVDLGAATIAKFNRVSVRVGATTRIAEDGQSVEDVDSVQ